jgi:hypothetical protein
MLILLAGVFGSWPFLMNAVMPPALGMFYVVPFLSLAVGLLHVQYETSRKQDGESMNRFLAFVWWTCVEHFFLTFGLIGYATSFVYSYSLTPSSPSYEWQKGFAAIIGAFAALSLIAFCCKAVLGRFPGRLPGHVPTPSKGALLVSVATIAFFTGVAVFAGSQTVTAAFVTPGISGNYSSEAVTPPAARLPVCQLVSVSIAYKP